MCTHFWNGDVFDSGDCASYPDSSMDSGDDSSMDDGCPGYCIGNWVGDNICDNLQCSMCPHFWDDNVFDGGDCGQHESTTAEATTEPIHGLVRGWPVDGRTFSDKWYKCNNCGWLPSSVGGVVQTMPQNDLGLTWHEACAWWCDQEPECVSAWHRISGNHCSLYNFTLPFAANNHPTSHIYVKPTPEYIMVSDASSCESVGMVTITTVSQCAAAVNALGFAENYSQDSVPSTD
eukprot:UN21322